MFVWEKEFFIECCMHFPCPNTFQSKTENMNVLYWKCQIAVLLRFCWLNKLKYVENKLNIICNEEPSISFQNVKKYVEECSFLRSYRIDTCSFTKNETASQVFFSQFTIKLDDSYGETCCSYKIDSICLVLQVESSSSLLSIIECINGLLNMESLFALLFIISYRSTRCTVCSQHNNMI